MRCDFSQLEKLLRQPNVCLRSARSGRSGNLLKAVIRRFACWSGEHRGARVDSYDPAYRPELSRNQRQKLSLALMPGYGVPRLAICPLPDASRVPIGRCNDDEISVRIANPKFAVIGVRISMYVKHDERA